MRSQYANEGHAAVLTEQMRYESKTDTQLATLQLYYTSYHPLFMQCVLYSLCKVHSISNDELIWAYESNIVHMHLGLSSGYLVQQAHQSYRCSLFRLKVSNDPLQSGS